MKKIILTGGGTAGHVVPNLALVSALKAEGFEIHYIGSRDGIERELAQAEGLVFYGISSGKLRRYFSLKNITDAFRVVKGVGEARKILKKIKPDLIFSKGGFVVVPVILAAKMLGIRTIIHESDISPGLANKIVMPFAEKICASFPETLNFLPKKARARAVLTGTPIRGEVKKGSRFAGLKFAGFDSASGKPVLLVTGGSLGAAAINAHVREALPQILQKFRVIHLCGKGNLSGISRPDYAEFEYVSGGMADILAAADVVVSRAGANTIFELLALRKPNLLIPLPRAQSRGDQIQNAESFERSGFSMILAEEKITPQSLYDAICALYDERATFTRTMSAHKSGDGVAEIMRVLRETHKK
ncbi:MAG: undecaprenyldiphospho-muramoylpentapeptide beta-N-acetylglucosaminyltransferase [Defluviitaleaceae bacterium]|nr:undecaprenyldiphospho-muramoylpentapeptide beta-N-acetylglucosaminyltransferase [Defluviitaleaceae bacterium]